MRNAKVGSRCILWSKVFLSTVSTTTSPWARTPLCTLIGSPDLDRTTSLGAIRLGACLVERETGTLGPRQPYDEVFNAGAVQVRPLDIGPRSCPINSVCRFDLGPTNSAKIPLPLQRRRRPEPNLCPTCPVWLTYISSTCTSFESPRKRISCCGVSYFLVLRSRRHYRD